MIKFKYRGYDAESVAQVGTLEAEDYADAYAALQYQGIVVISLAPAKTDYLKLFLDYVLKLKLGRRWCSVFFRELSVMLRVMTLHESLQTLTKAAEGHVSEKMLQELVKSVEYGERFSYALRKYAVIFDGDIIQSIEVGEQSGKMQEITLKIANQLERNYTTGRKVQGAMRYPMFVFLAAIIAAVVMINVTLPVFESFYSENGGKLPLITLILLSGGRFLNEYLFLIFIFALVGAVSLVVAYHEVEHIRYSIDKLKLEMKILREIELRNFFSRLGFLLESGVTLNESLKLIVDSSKNSHMCYLLNKIQVSIEQGDRFSDTLKRVFKDFPSLYLGLIVTGESSGNFVEMLRQCESIADFEIDEVLKELPTKAEIYGTLAAGIIVGALVFAMVLPILSMTDLF